MSNTERSTEQHAVLDVIRQFYAALGRGDVPGVVALLDEKVEWTEAQRFPYYSGTWVGPQAVIDNLLVRLATEWEGFTATAHDFMVEGDRVVSFGTYAGTYKATGKSMSSDFAHRWSVRHGKITHFLMYTDTAKVLEALQ